MQLLQKAGIIFFVLLALVGCKQKFKEESDARYAFIIQQADSLLRIAPDSAQTLYNQVFVDSNQSGPTLFVGSMIGLSTIYKGQGKLDSAVYMAQRSREISNELGDTSLILRSLLLSGNIFNAQHKNKEALEFYSNGLKLARSIGSPDDENGFLISIGKIQFDNTDYAAAFKTFSEAAGAAHEAGKIKKESAAYGNLALVMKYQGDLKNAIKYCHKAIELDKKSGLKLDLAGHMLNMGVFYENLNNNDSALAYYNMAETIFGKSGDSMMIVRILFNKSNVFRNLKQYSEAISNLHSVLDFSTRNKVVEGKIYAFSTLATIYSETGASSNALALADSGIMLAREAGILTTLSDLYTIRSNVLSRLGMHKEALATLIEAHQITDSLKSESKQKEITELQVKFDTELKEREIKSLSEKLDANLQTRRLQTYINVLLALLVLGSVAVSVYIYRLLKTRTAAYNALLSIYYGNNADAVALRGQTITENQQNANETEPEIHEQKDESTLYDSIAAPEQSNLSDIIRKLFDEDKIYLDAQLTLDKMAVAAGVTKKELNLELKNSFQTGFYPLLGRYRVDHAMKMLNDRANDHLKVEYIGLKSGFNSRPTFYSTFTQYTGLPPAVYRQGIIDQALTAEKGNPTG